MKAIWFVILFSFLYSYQGEIISIEFMDFIESQRDGDQYIGFRD